MRGGWAAKNERYAGVDELEVFRPKVDNVASGGKDKVSEVVFGDFLKPFIKVGTAFFVNRRHDLLECKGFEVSEKAVKNLG